ncbi:MAG: (d)CMP kinase, partial [Alphaproteobacteria bacterium]|nr:(d)CMP kinase [Alphaproteobacteria bacterium]
KLYRAVGLAVLRENADPEDAGAALRKAQALRASDLDDPALAGDDAAVAASKVAAIPEVREALLDFQRTFAARPPNGGSGAVIDGRDIGTVVCPEAEVKLYVTAAIEVRAARRHKELLERGETSIYSRVLQDLKDRDARDSSRSAAPLRAADDAKRIDTTEMTADAAFDAALAYVEERQALGQP